MKIDRLSKHNPEAVFCYLRGKFNREDTYSNNVKKILFHKLKRNVLHVQHDL